MPVQDNMKNVRMFEISTKKDFLDEAFITGALALPAVDKWVYVLHDKDKDDNDPSKPKDPHWHIYVS